MKKIIVAILLIFTLVLTLTSCGSNNSSSNNSNAENDAEQEMEESSDTVETEVRKPTSDVVDGTGIEGTWKGTQTNDGSKLDIILALNSNGTYGIWFGDSGDTGASADEFDGTYSVDGSNLNLTPNEVDDAQTFSLGDGSYPFTLDGNKLTVKDSDGQEIAFTRDEAN